MTESFSIRTAAGPLAAASRASRSPVRRMFFRMGSRGLHAGLATTLVFGVVAGAGSAPLEAQLVSREGRELVRPASDTLPREPWGRRLGAPPVSTRRYEEERRYSAPEARQGVAADADHFYAVSNRTIAKYDRESGERVALFESPPDGPLIHLNSCIVLEARLICAHSNHPGIPMLSSVEIFDTATLEPVESRSLGVYEGSLTWVIRHDGSWWMHFAHYGNYSGVPGHGPEWSSLMRFDDDWRRLESYAYPVSLVEAFTPNSSSGGNFGADGRLYVTGHDEAEVYVLELPEQGSVLEWVETIPAPMEGQAWVFDPTDPLRVFGILRGSGEVVTGRLR